MGTEGHLPGEMQPPLIPNSLSRRGWAVAAWGFQLSPPPLPTGFAAATLTHVSFPAPHFLLLKEITHHLPPGNRFKSPFEETAYLPQGCSSGRGASSRWLASAPQLPPLSHGQKALSCGDRLLCMGSAGPEPHLGQSGLRGVCSWNE